MARIAFYAPLKSPNHPVPSGDRKMARLLQKALAGAACEHHVTLVSQLRSFEGKGDPEAQKAVAGIAAQEIERLQSAERFDLWVTYHTYYKAPDLLGPTLGKLWNVPYVLFEATRARKRIGGPWDFFAQAAETANDAADLIFHFTRHDGVALHEQMRAGQTIAHLPPFLDLEHLPSRSEKAVDRQKILLSVAMMRGPDKVASYTRLRDILSHIKTKDWHLAIVGDGPRRAEVEALFSPFGAQVRFTGQLDAEGLNQAYTDADIFLWPGINEAYGMVYLEAQAAGLPAIAEDRPGVRDILPSETLVPMDDPVAFAARIDSLLGSQDALDHAADAARALVLDRHLFPAAQSQIFKYITPLLESC